MGKVHCRNQWQCPRCKRTADCFLHRLSNGLCMFSFQYFPCDRQTENVFTKKRSSQRHECRGFLTTNRNYNLFQRDEDVMRNWDFWYCSLLAIHTSSVVSSSHHFKCLNYAIVMCPASYQRKGLCNAVNCSLSYNPITTCLKVGLLLPYSVAGRVKILSGPASLGSYLSSSFT